MYSRGRDGGPLLGRGGTATGSLSIWCLCRPSTTGGGGGEATTGGGGGEAKLFAGSLGGRKGSGLSSLGGRGGISLVGNGGTSLEGK